MNDVVPVSELKAASHLYAYVQYAEQRSFASALVEALVPATVQPGLYNVRVSTPAGTNMTSGKTLYVGKSAPALSGINPSVLLYNGSTRFVTLSGANFLLSGINILASQSLPQVTDDLDLFDGEAGPIFWWHHVHEVLGEAPALKQHAAELREAALLLEPEDLEQRLGVIGDLYRWKQPADREQYEQQRQQYGQSRAAEFLSAAAEAEAKQRRINLTLACGHLEYLLRRRALNLSEAELIASQLLLQLDYFSRHYHAGAPEVQAEARAWFWRIYGQFPRLDPELAEGMVRDSVARAMRGGFAQRVPHSALSQQERFLASAVRRLLAEADRSRSPNWEQLADDYYRFLTEVADPDLLLPLPASPPGDDVQKARFAQRLIDSGQPANVFRGRLELLVMEVEGRRPRRPWRELRREWQNLSAQWERCLDDDPNYRTAGGAA